MADPTRLVDDPGSPLVHSLLASAEGDAPAADRRAAIGKRLGITAAVLASSTKASAVTGSAALWWKLGVLGVLLAGGAGVAMMRDTSSPTAPTLTHVDPPRIVEAPPVAVVEPPVPDPIVEPPLEVPAIVEPPVEVTPPPPPRRTRSAKVVVTPPPVVEPGPESAPEQAAPPVATPAPAPAPIDARRLALEVGLLDSARAALRNGDPTAALAILARHDREFADGALVAEAEVIRIEALVDRGDVAAARARATAFATRFPRSPLVRRVQSIVKEKP